MDSERTHGHPPQTLPSRALQFPQGDKLNAVSDGPESKSVRGKGPGPETCKGLWEMDSRRAGISDEAVKGFMERVAREPGLADGWDLISRSGHGEEGCCRRRKLPGQRQGGWTAYGVVS